MSAEPDSTGEFLPDLCAAPAVLVLVLVGELLALVLVVADTGLAQFNWEQLALVSFLLQWVILCSAALLCRLRPLWRLCSAQQAGGLSFALVLLVTALVTLGGQWLLGGFGLTHFDSAQLAGNLFIAAVFTGITLRYYYLQQQLSYQQQAELKARIQALQSRIRPHFLFNSMNSIASLIETDPQTAERVVEDLSDLFRSGLAEPSLVPIADELEIAKRYINIEQVRLGPRLQVDWQVQALPAEATIPSLLLQPLLENAIYHGIQPLPEGGVVTIRVLSRDKRIEIDISNPVGDKAMVQHKGNRLALENIRYRLAAHYGGAAQIRVEQQSQLYTLSISYPLGGEE